MAGVSPAIIDIVDTSFDILTIIRPGALPIKSVILKQDGNNLFSYSMDKRTDLSNGDQLWGTNFAFPQGSFGIQAIPIVWGNSLNEFTIEVIDSAQQKAPGYPLLRSGNYPLVTSATTCNLFQVFDPTTNTCMTPIVKCTRAAAEPGPERGSGASTQSNPSSGNGGAGGAPSQSGLSSGSGGSAPSQSSQCGGGSCGQSAPSQQTTQAPVGPTNTCVSPVVSGAYSLGS